jgi:hypothetical protein
VVDLKNDQLQVRCDSAHVTPKQMLAVIDDKGFQGKVISSE